MRNKFLVICLAVILTTSLVGSSLAQAPTNADIVKSVQSLGMFQDGKFTAHYRVPNDTQVEDLLEQQGIFLVNADAKALAVKTFREEWALRNPTTPNPEKLQKLLDNERQGGPRMMDLQTTNEAAPQIMSLAVPVEFPNTDTFDWCGTSVTTVGPLHNEIPAPGPRDNNTIWYENTTPDLYTQLYFGVGPKAGVIVNHPNLGKVDLRGNTMANYYLEQSEGQFVPKGLIYPKWLQASHSEGWYGADNCSGSNHNVLAGDLVVEVVDAINVDNPDFSWETYDGDGDGVVDNFTVIHAGMGQEAGGGTQGDFAIWSHASAIEYPTGKLACTAGAAGCPDRNIYVREYSMDPENIDVGVISEEFGHAAFGLPDIYTTDAQGSPSNWAIMEAGSWNGILGGMQPAPFPLFFRYIVGWASPEEMDYTTAAKTITVGQLSLRPRHTAQGIKINLPDQVVNTPNLAGTGQGWWSGQADLADFYLAHDFDLTTAVAPIFSFSSYWSFEEDYDYGYVEVSEDFGATWIPLIDMDGFMVDDGTGVYALNGENQGILRFDLSGFTGKQITLRLHDISDVGVQWAGWWADDFVLADGATTLFTDDVENPPNGWTTNAFQIVPLNRTYPLYYLAEWRNLSGFDRGLAYPYTTVYSDDDEWQVDRCPYSVPGMLLWLRNAAYDFDYTLYNALYDSPSYGPKHALLVVDSHFWPLEWEGMGTTDAHLRLNSRCQPGNSTFTLQKTKPFTARRGDGLGGVLETKTFAALPGVSQFHDSLGYYPGLRYREADGGLYFWDAAASVVIPAKDNYTTRITWGDKTPLYDLYGYDLGDTILGSGDPRDDKVQYGLNIAVLDKASDGSWGRIAVWNAEHLVKLDMSVLPDKTYAGQYIVYHVEVRNPGPASQPFTVTIPIPANTTFYKESPFFKFYDAASNSIVWKGTLPPRLSQVYTYVVQVNRGTPGGTVITNTAVLTDNALGASKTVTTLILKKK